MRSVVVRMFTFLRARWRWTRGRCPRCSRNLYAPFPCYMADDPHCPVCKDEARADLRMWHQYRALGTAARPGAVTGSRVDPGRQTPDPERAWALDRWHDDGGLV